MKKHMLNHCKSRNPRQAKYRLSRLHQNGIESDYNGLFYVIGNGHMVLGLEMASKAFRIICDVELGKLNALPKSGRNFARRNDGAVGKGFGNKQMLVCNRLDRGSKFASAQKGADFPMVFRCMNRN